MSVWTLLGDFVDILCIGLKPEDEKRPWIWCELQLRDGLSGNGLF